MDKLVSLKVSKKLKELGFNLVSPGWYGCDDPSGKSVSSNQYFQNEWTKFCDVGKPSEILQKNTEIYSAPTINMVQKWLREEHNIVIESKPIYEHKKIVWRTVITRIYDNDKNRDEFSVLPSTFVCAGSSNFGSYDDALINGIESSLKFEI